MKLYSQFDDWKPTFVTIHKKGPKDILGNYRPISLTSVIFKILESLVQDELVKHMLKHLES